MAASAIEWTDEVWNPVTGCDRVSPGCAHCYALELAPRLRAMGNRKYIEARDGGKSSGPAFGVTLHPDVLEQPLRWRRPRRVFVNSMSDLFHEEVPLEFIAAVWAVMERAEAHTFQILTKRPERMNEVVRSWKFCKLVAKALDVPCDSDWLRMYDAPLSNVWLGVSIENRRYVDRAHHLRRTPAAVRFISAEPLLGPLVKQRATTPDTPRVERPALGGVTCRNCGRAMGTWQWQCAYADCGRDRWPDGYSGPELDLTGIDWLIVGGESGAKARRIDPDWVRDLRDACLHDFSLERPGHRTAFFFKQWGGRTPKAGGRLLDGREWSEFPQRTEVAL